MSVAAVQERLIWVGLVAVALSSAGAVGGVVSGGGSPSDRRRHVGLDLRLGQRGVVDAHLVDATREVLPVERVAADRQRPAEVAMAPELAVLATCVPFTYRRSVAPS